MYNYLVLFLFAIAGILLIRIWIKAAKERKTFIGKPPIKGWLFALGKMSLLISFILLIIQSLNINISLISLSEQTAFIATIIFIVGMIFLLEGMHTLGTSLRAGFPKENIELKTTGIYKITRNPIYLGFFIILLASNIFVIHPVNWLFSIIALVIHHHIIKNEEMFLEKRFKIDWIEYKSRVRRYF
jgi:protein-S-isoprenylcysteine O-methyltransferase Ste14